VTLCYGNLKISYKLYNIIDEQTDEKKILFSHQVMVALRADKERPLTATPKQQHPISQQQPQVDGD